MRVYVTPHSGIHKFNTDSIDAGDIEFIGVVKNDKYIPISEFDKNPDIYWHRPESIYKSFKEVDTLVYEIDGLNDFNVFNRLLNQVKKTLVGSDGFVVQRMSIQDNILHVHGMLIEGYYYISTRYE